MAVIPEQTEDEKRAIAIRVLRDAADMIETADYIHIDNATLTMARALKEIFIDPAQSPSYKQAKESSFNVSVNGEIGNN